MMSSSDWKIGTRAWLGQGAAQQIVLVLSRTDDAVATVGRAMLRDLAVETGSPLPPRRAVAGTTVPTSIKGSDSPGSDSTWTSRT